MSKTNCKPSMKMDESDTLGLPSITFLLGEVPSPNPEDWWKTHKPQKPSRDMEQVINRLIVHLQDWER